MMPSFNPKEEDSKMKRSDSREMLNVYPVSMALADNVENSGQNDNDNDFESL